MSEDTGFRPTHPAMEDTQPDLQIPRHVPPPRAAHRPEAGGPSAAPPPGASPGEHITPQTLPPEPRVVERAPGWLWAIASGAFVIALVSLALNLLLVSALLERQKAFQAMMDQSLAALDSASTTGFKFNFPISQTIDFEGDIPFQQDMVFPFKGNVRINTTFRVPVRVPGTSIEMTVPVPIDQTVPVDTAVPVHIDQTFHVKTKVPIKMDVPIELSPQQPPLSDGLSALRQWLEQMRRLMD